MVEEKKFRDGRSASIPPLVPVLAVAIIVVGAFAYVSEARRQRSNAVVGTDAAAEAVLPEEAESLPSGDRFSVISDALAQHFLESRDRKGGEQLVAVTKRIGPDGVTSFTRWEIACEAGTSRVLATGGSLDAVAGSNAVPGPMQPHTEASVAGEVASYVCALEGPNSGAASSDSDAARAPSRSPLAIVQSAVRENCRRLSDQAGGSYTLMEACIIGETEAGERVARMDAPEEIIHYCSNLLTSTTFSWTLMEACMTQEMEAKARLSQ